MSHSKCSKQQKNYLIQYKNMVAIIILAVIILGLGYLIAKSGLICEDCGGVFQPVYGWENKRECHRCGKTISI